MKILIVGAGTAGLAVAAFLQKGSHDITIIEKDKKWDRRGYAIALFNNGFKMLQKLPQGKTITKVGHIFTHYRIMDKRGKSLQDIDYTKIHIAFGPSLIILRKELHTFLLAITKQPIKMGISVNTIMEKNDHVEVQFSNGKRDTFDFVIGADGITSTVRSLVFTPDARKFFGREYWAGLTAPLATYTPTFPEAVMHKNKAFMVYPYDKQNNLCFTFMRVTTKNDTDEKVSSVELLRKNFSDIDYAVPEILKMLPRFEEMYHGVLSEVRLRKWYSKRVVLIGDAAHATLPTPVWELPWRLRMRMS